MRKYTCTEKENGRPHTIQDVINFLIVVGKQRGFDAVLALPRRVPYVPKGGTPMNGVDLTIQFDQISTEMFSEGEEVDW